MPRPPDFTPEEDAILLATVGQTTEETNTRLVEAGYKARLSTQLKYRRYYLRSAPTPAHRADEALSSEMVRRRELGREQVRLRRELERVDEEIAASGSRIHELMARVGAMLAPTSQESAA